MSTSSRRVRAPRVLVIGLDGATLTLVRPLVAAGRLPNLSRLMREGAHGPLESIIPAHTGAAWPSMISGRNPGKHGLFDFERMDVSSYACLDGFATSETLVGRTLFDLASASAMRVAALRVPMTYPTWPVNGVMSSGYPAPPRSDRYAYPETLAAVLPPVAFLIHGRTPDLTLANLQREMEVLTTAACQILAADHYDLFMLVYQQPDQAHHLFWRYVDPASPLYTEAAAAVYGDLIAQCYVSVDSAIGRLLTYVDDNTLILVVSDHGAERAPDTYFETNAWLRGLGLLAPSAHQGVQSRMQGIYNLRHAIPKDMRRLARRWLIGSASTAARSKLGRISHGTASINWAQTVAYWFPVHQQMEGIALNVRGRQPEGIVEPGEEYTRLRERLIDELRTLRQPDSDSPLVVEIHRRAEAFWGMYAERAPDLLYRLAPGFQSHNSLEGPLFARVPPTALERHSAWHDRTGLIMARGPSIAAGTTVDGASLLDIAPTVLRALGLPLSSDLDGQPLEAVVGAPSGPNSGSTVEDALSIAELDAAHDRFLAATDAIGRQSEHTPAVSLSSEEEESIRHRLRSLGYL
jgi:predicted AlkP superfamily phosphohydrolase/phosphomutase